MSTTFDTAVKTFGGSVHSNLASCKHCCRFTAFDTNLVTLHGIIALLARRSIEQSADGIEHSLVPSVCPQM